jgi:ABC-2 type transport system permease protein
MKGNADHLPGLFRHFLLCLELNFRSTQALVYGYAVPVLFLVAFGSVFRAETPALLGEMGQILTITVLGGACFGMPTALVAERERGIWRRYRLRPVATGSLVCDVLIARIVIVMSAAVLQVALARVAYQTPLPIHPAEMIAGVVLVSAAFQGMGLLVAALADDVPAVQAIGQCLFMPMILIGGVGIPLAALPDWAQRVSAFMPGRYAVDVLQRCYIDPIGLGSARFSMVALCVIGLGAGIAGARLFRWDSGRRAGRTTWIWLAAALCAWVAVGATAGFTGRLKLSALQDRGFAAVTEEQIDAITYENLPGDAEFVSRLARPFKDGGEAEGVGGISSRLKAWGPGHSGDPGRDARALLSVAAIADVGEDPHEGEIARLVFQEMRSELGDERLSRVLAWIVLSPRAGKVATSAPELGLRGEFREEIVRERIDLYARKFLGKLRGKIPD